MSTAIIVQAIDPEVAAADFLAVHELLKRVEAKAKIAREAVIKSFQAANVTEAGDVLCSESHPRSASVDAALRLKNPDAVEAITTRSTSVALVEAALKSGVITARQFAQIITTSDEPTFTVQPVTRKVPKAVAELVTAA